MFVGYKTLLLVTETMYHCYYVLYLCFLDFNGSSHGAFTSGWSFINRKKDVSDFEWAVWAQFLYASAPWLCIHLVGAEIVRYTSKEVNVIHEIWLKKHGIN